MGQDLPAKARIFGAKRAAVVRPWRGARTRAARL